MHGNILRRFISLLLIVFILSSCKEQIVHDLSESEANRLLTRLYESDIHGEKRVQSDGQWAIAVNKSEAIEALSKLSTARVLRHIEQESRPVAQAGMLPSREVQRFQYERAISKEIEVTLTALRGVLDARVHLNLPVHDPLLGKGRAKNFNTTGSVLIVADTNFSLPKEEVAALVGGASGLKADEISVLIASDKDNSEEEKEADVVPVVESFVVAEPEVVESKVVENKVEIIESSDSNTPSFFTLSLLLLLSVLIVLLVKKIKHSYKRLKAGSNFKEQLEGMVEVC